MPLSRIRERGRGEGQTTLKGTGEFRGKSVAVIGIARAGSAAARALKALGARVTLYDPKPFESLGEEATALREEDFDLVSGCPDYPGIDAAEIVVTSPGVRPDAPVLSEARSRGATVIGEIEVAYRLAEAPIIAITGTNGKSTTTAMCGAMLEGAYPRVWVGGNLAPGEPLSALALSATAEDVIVAEVSSFQLEQTTSFRPKVAVLTNLTPDHFDRHPDLSDYGSAKSRIFRFQSPSDYAIINAAYRRMPELDFYGRPHGRPCLFGVEKPEGEACRAWVEEGWLVASREDRSERLAPISALPVPGRHNVENALAASQAAWLMGAKPDDIRRGLESFRPVAHRMEPVATVNGVRYVNNSMCTNPAALVASLEAFEEPTILISGGKNKNLDFSAAGPIMSLKAKAVVLIGTAAEEIERAIGTGGAPVFRTDSLEEAVRKAASVAEPGSVVMLAPGCASMDMFQDFMDRGERFVQAVHRLSETA